MPPELNLTQDFSIQCDPQPLIQDRINCLVNTGQNRDYKCWTTVRQGNLTNYLQVNPSKTEFTSTVLPTETESREYFSLTNGMGNVYYTDNSLLQGNQYVLGVKCVDSNGTTLLSEQAIAPVYGNLDVVAARGVWVKDNLGYIIGAVIALIIIIAVVMLVVNK